MPHPLVDQLRFTRREWLRALAGVSDEDAGQRLLPMNSIRPIGFRPRRSGENPT